MPPKKRLSQQKDQELNGFIDEMIGEGIADNEIQSFVNDFVAKYGEDVPTTTAPKTAPEVKKKEVQPSNPKMQPIENTDVFFGGLVTPIQNLKTAQKNGNSKPTQEQKIVQEQKVNKREPKPSYLQKVFSPIKKAYEEATNIPQENKREIVKKTAQKLLGFTPTDEQIDNELKANPHKFDDALVVDYKNNNDIDEFTSMPFESTSKVDEIREKVEQGLPLSQTELELVKGGLSKAYQGFSEVPNDEIQSGLIALMKSEREKVKNNIITAYNRNELEGRINSGNVRPEDIENIFSIAHKGTLNEQIDYNDIATKYNEKQKEIMRNVDESIDKGVQTLIEFDEQLKIQKSHAKDNLDIAKAQNDIFNNQQTKEDVKYAQSQLDLISDLERKRNKYLDGQIEQATNAAVKEMLYQFSPYLETDKNGFLNEVGTYNLPRLVEDYVSRQSKGKQALLTYKNNGQIKGNVYLENALRQEVDFSAKNHEILKKVEGGITSSMPESAKPLIGQVLGLQRGKDGEIIPENAVHKMNAVNTAKTFQLQIEVDKQNISLENALRSPEVRALIGDELDDLNEQYSQHKISATDFKNARLKLLLQTPQTKNIADSYISAVINASKQNEREVRNYVNTLAPDFAKYTKFNSKGEVESIAGLSPQEFANAMSQVDRGRNKAREFAFEDFVYRSSERGNEEMNKAILESGGTVEAVASMAFKNTLFNMTQSRAKWLYDKTGIDFFNEARKGMMYGANKSEEYLASDFAQSYTDYEAGDWGALTNPYFWVHSVSSSAPYMVESMATGYLGGMGIGSALLKMGMSEGVGTAIALSRSGRIAQKVVGGILGGTEEAFSNMQMNYTDLINEGYSVQEASRISKSAFAMEVIPNVVLSGISLETLFRATSKPTFKNVVKKGLTTILEQGTTEPIGEVNQGFVVEKAKGSDIGFWDYGMNTKDGFNNLIGGFAGSLGSGGGMTAFHLVADAARWNKIYNISTNEMQDAVRQSGVADMVRNVSPTRRKLNLDILAQNSLDYEHQYQNTPAGQEKEELRKKAREALAIYNYAKEYASQIEGKDVNDINADYLAHTRALSKQYQVLADNASSSNKNNYQRQADYYAGIAEQVERGKPSEIYAFQTPNGRVFISENTARVLADGSLRKSNDSFNESVRDGAITGIDVSNNEEVRKKLEDKFNVALKSKPAPISPTISQEQGDLITQNIEEENKAKQQAQQLQLDNSSPILVVEENGKFTVNNPSGVKETFDTREEADKRVVEINEQLSNAPNELEVVEKNGKFEVENAGKIETFDTREEADKRVVEINEQLSNAPNELEVVEKNGKFEVENAGKIETFDTRQEAENRINEIKNKTPQNETTINAETANTESTATIGQENLSKTQDEVDSDIDKTKGGITTEIDSQEITEGNPRKGTFEGIEIEVSKTDNGYTYSTPEFDVEVSEDEHNENLKNKSLILNAVVSSSDDTNRNTTTSTPTAETATNQEVDNSQNVDELIGKEVLFNGERGVIKQDEGGKITFENDKVIRELTSDDKAIEFVEDKQERPEISVLGNEVKVGNDVYEFVSTNLDKNGNVVSVTLINDKGQKITNRNADLALDIAIAKNNDEFNRRTEGQTTEQTTEQTAEIVSNELNNSNLNVLNELVNEMPTVVGNAIDELRNTDKDKEPKKVNELIEKINKWIDKTKENVRNSNAPKAEKSNAIIALDNLKNNLNTKAKQEVEKTLQNINRKINKQNEKLEKQGVDKTPTTTKAKTAPSTNENTVENETEQTEQSSDKQTADRISKETKEELPNLDDDFLENIPKVVDDTLTAMRNDIEALAPEEMQAMVLETAEWIDDSIKSARNSKMTDKEKNKVVNSLNKIKTNLNKYYEKLEKQRVAKTTNVTTTETIRGNESTPQQHETTNAPTTATEGTFIGADGNLRNEPNGIEQIEQAEKELSRNEEEIRENEERLRAERQRIDDEKTAPKGEQKADKKTDKTVDKKEDNTAEKLKQEQKPKVSSTTEFDTNKQPINKLEDLQDVGEKIGGAKKDLAQKLSEVTTDDLATKPLSKVFPKPDFKRLVEEGSLSEEGAILLNYLYDNIPTKPRRQYRVANWVKTVDGALQTTRQVLEAESTKNLDFTKKILDAVTLSETLKREYKLYSDTMKGLGFPKNDVKLGGYEIKKFENRRKYNNETEQYETAGDVYSIVNGSSIIGDFKTMDDAISGLKNLLNKSKEKTKGTKFDIYQDRKTKEFFIGKKGAIDVVRVMQGFKTLGEARNFLKEKQADIQGLWDAMKAPKERRMANRPRVGIDWRKGKNIDSKEFADTFGFRGVEFGNWVNNAERQSHVNEAYDALMDLASVLGVSPKALSLNGELGFAFGARGSGKANAHYESGKVVINLTKTRGAGSLAHEWWHALDNYFSRARNEKDKFITDRPRDLINRDGSRVEGVRKEMIDAFKSVMDAIKGTKLSDRSKVLDRTRSEAYWSTPIEMSARSFESYIIEKLAERNQQNDYLANLKSTEEWIKDAGSKVDATKNYPYPLKEESHSINEKFQQFFETIKEDESNKLYHKGEVNQGGNVSSVLERNGIEQGKRHYVGDFNEFIKNNGSALVKGIWRIINKTADLLGVNIKIISDEDYFSKYPKDTNGAFRNGNIVIRSGIFADPKRAAYILTHEVTHGTTSHIIDAVKNGNKEVLSKLTDKQIKAAQDLSKLFDRIKNRKDLKGQYGIEDEHEFLSELSNPEFAGKLKGKDKGIIERILDLVMGVLGIQKNDYDKARTILRDLMTKPDNVGTYSQDSDDIRYHRDSSGNVVIEGKNKERLDKLVEEIKGIDDKKQREDKLEEVKKGIENNPLLRGKNQADYRSKFIDYVSEKIEDFEAQKEQERLDKEAKDKAEQEAKEKAEQEAKEKLVEGAVEYETNKSIKQILNKRLDENNYSHIMFDDSLTPKEGTAKQEAAKTQGKYQDRVVDSNYVKQSLDMLKEISIETAHELEQLLGDEWQDKVIKYLEDGWGAKPAHAIGILNIISTDIYNQLQSDELTQNEYDNLKEKQKRVDTLANAISRDISQGMNMRRLYQVFAQGGDVTTAIAESYLPEKTVEEINNLRESISRAKTDAELANAGRPKGTKSSTKTTNQNNTSVNKSSKKELLQRMKDKANNLVNKSGKKIDDIVNEIIDKIKKLKC